MFADSLEMVGFTGSAEGLRPSAKHRQRTMQWKEPTNSTEKEEVADQTEFLPPERNDQ